MAGMGPPPKHSSVRARTNKTSTRATLSEPDGDVVIPPLPTRYDDEGEEVAWHRMTLMWWADLWPSPMAQEYHPSDIHGLYRLAHLIDNFWNKPTDKAHAEVRLAQKDYGLTPLDRRRLEWTIENTERAKDEGAKRRRDTAPPVLAEPQADPRLYVV